MELLDELFLAIYLDSRNTSKYSRRLQIVKAYEEAEDILITRAVYLDNLVVNDTACKVGYKNHKYVLGTCVRCGYVFNQKEQQDLRIRRMRYRINHAKIT